MNIKTATLLVSLTISGLSMSMTADAQSKFSKFFKKTNPSTSFEGGVYAMSNDIDANTIVAYGRNDDGTLELIDSFRTGGKGGIFDGGEGLDPLISAYSVIMTEDREHLLAVNAGSNSISVFEVRDDFSLR